VAAAQGVQVAIVGAGPAGLATAACLRKRGVDALVLEAERTLGASWRRHYDRLHLHTVKAQSHLPGLAFSAEVPRYPSRDEVVAYLEAYAAKFGIAPRTGVRVTRVRAAGDALVVETERATYEARAVVMAAGFNRVPNPERLPGAELFRGPIVHAAQYRTGASFAGQRVLVVGAGNTGAEIALDLAEQGATPTLAARTAVNVVPRSFLGIPIQLTSIGLRKAPLPFADACARVVSRLSFGDLSRYGLPRATVGALSAIRLRRRIPVIDVGTIAAIKRGAITVKPAVAHLTDAGAVFVDGTACDLDAVVLATGYRPALAQLVDVPGALDAEGLPASGRGARTPARLFFVGYNVVASGVLREIGREAAQVADAIAAAA
jgi:cation diffusion facilitator CzcD-associated flavoprotein CzcO